MRNNPCRHEGMPAKSFGGGDAHWCILQDGGCGSPVGSRRLRLQQPDLRLRVMEGVEEIPYLTPTLGRHGNYLIISSSEKLVHGMIDAESGKKPEITSSPDFQKLSSGLPEKGNGIAYVGTDTGLFAIDTASKKLLWSVPLQAGVRSAPTVGSQVVVVAGDARGGTLGFPTANLRLDPSLLVPKYGIYAGAAEGHRAAISIGTNPHYGGGERRVEAYLLDFEGDLYGKRLLLQLWRRLRDERAFESEQELVAQIARDVEETQAAEPPI
jgi:hypothetical protein